MKNAAALQHCILIFYFPPTNSCLFGWSVDDYIGRCLVNPFKAFRPRQVRRTYMPPTKAPLPTKVPKPSFLKPFRVGQGLAISAEGSHCSGQFLRAITSSTVLSR